MFTCDVFINETILVLSTAVKMHEKNLEMKQLREDMEKKMREQLVRLMRIIVPP